ncbi:hypothetical protein [Tsukamurella pseudospumae]|nr:hypothetical protein [Tsukamurella pseudospumae]
MPIRDRALHEAAIRVALPMVAREGFDRVSLTAVADRLRLPGEESVSERTLRRKYGSTARLLFGTPWWLPEPDDAVRAVLEPRPDRAEPDVWPSGPAAEAAAAVLDDCRCEGGVPARDVRDRPSWCRCEDGRTDDAWPDAEFFGAAGGDDPLGPLARTVPSSITLRGLRARPARGAHRPRRRDGVGLEPPVDPPAATGAARGGRVARAGGAQLG